MKRFSAIALAVILFASVLVTFLPDIWASSLLEAGAFALAILWLGVFLRRATVPQTSFVLFPLCGLVAWVILQLLLNQTVYRWQTWNALLYWASNLAVFFVGLQTFSNRAIREGFLNALVLFGFILSVISPLQMYTSGGKVFWLFQTRYVDYVLGPFVYHNQYAAFIELVLPVALFYAFADSRKAPYYSLVCAVMYTSVIASASRAGFVMATLELFLVPLLLIRRRIVPLARLKVASAYFGGMLLVLAIAAGPRLWERFQVKDPYSVRREFMYSSFQMIRDKPLLGFGLGNWPTAYPGYAYFDDGLFANQAHNDWAQWATEGGIPFALLVLSIALWSARESRVAPWGAGVSVMFLHCFVDYPTQRIALAGIMFSLLSAMACGVSLQVARCRFNSE